MYRRALLVAVAGLSGCTSLVGNPLTGNSDSVGEQGSSGGGSSDTATPDSDETATTGEPTPDPISGAATLSPEELAQMSVADLLSLSRDQLSQAVETYSDAGTGESLTAVTAATDTFDPPSVVDHLYAARRAYEAADRQGLPAEQREEINRLGRVEAFLRLSIDSQVFLIEAHNDLEGVVGAVEFVDPETARSLTERAGNRQRRASQTVTDLSNAKYERSVGIVDGLSRAEYLNKRDQFRAETDVLGDLTEALPQVVEGVTLFAQARGRRKSGAPYVAASLGRDAEDAFDRGTKALRAVASRIPRQAQGFNGVASALVSAAEDGRIEARAFHRDIDG